MNICLTGNTFHPIAKGELITGYNIAASDLVNSFFNYSAENQIYCLYEPWQIQQAALENMLRHEKVDSERIHLISEYDLLFRGVSRLPKMDILHSVKEDAIPLISMRQAMKSDIPVTFTLHGIAEQHLIMDFFYPMLLLPFKPYDAVICTSESVRKTIENMFHRLEDIVNRTLSVSSPIKHQIRLEKIPLGVDISNFKPLDKIRCRKKFGFETDEFIILWFGRFSDLFKADLFPLLHVFHKLLLNNKDKKLRLILAGSQDVGTDYAGKMYSEAQHIGIEKYVSIIFNHEIEKRSELYSACDVFTSPIDNIQETFGLTPVEAMACGVPQVVSDWDGYRDTVGKETGFLIKTSWTNCMEDIATADYLPSNVNRRRMLQCHLQVRSVAVDCTDYYEKLQLLIDKPHLRQAFSEASRRRAVEHFSLQNTVKQTEALWCDLYESASVSNGDFQYMNIPMIDYCNDFQYYPTQMLKEEKIFEATEYGKTTSVKELLQYPIFNQTVEEAILPEYIMKYKLEVGSVSMSDVINKYSDFGESQVKREIMYLYKYDMIRPV